ncbi:MAG: bifunctional UDP-N-acetylmuramoyl-tripeptide:D-alanyl-D-alanine ligase/alanine racemase [Flavobacteriales bacterium]|nr:bifunctional UDP-N-acetylmuramoyl-tripeptide:D-alanyl-D-alanine ligase/alanine racemase [Flavobacteriales bacterium]
MSAFRYSMATIAEALGGRLVMGAAAGAEIDRVIIDSRHADTSPGALFIALRGPRNDGHDHIAELRSKGLRDFMVLQDRISEVDGVNAIIVEDTLVALQRFAAWHRARFNIPVIGITGSNGKTIVKEWLWQMLHHEENIVRSPGSWNSQVGVPLSVLRMGLEHTLGIFEAGISKPGEMERLEAIIRPTIGVLTSIGDAHDEGFHGDRALKLSEKRKLFSGADVVVSRSLDAPRSIKELTIGADDGNFVTVEETQVLDGSCGIDITHDGVGSSFTIPFDDNASIENALTCIGVCLHLGRSPEWIRERLALLVPVDMRMRTVQGAHGTTLIDDTYSLDKSSLLSALDHMRRVAHGRPMVAVLSDLVENTGDAGALYREVAQALAQAGVERIIAVGPVIGSQRASFSGKASFHESVEALLQEEGIVGLAGAVVLIKGARRFGFERIVERWQQQVHGTELEINLEAILHNLNHYRALISSGVRTMAMVKAFGYGSGAVELARLFEHERVHYLGVAYADEGIELRSHGITMPIMVMNPEPVAMETLHRFRLEPEVYDLRSLNEAIASAKQMHEAPPVHIKLDTGMHRLGFMGSDMPALLEQLRSNDRLRVSSILSHLAASEDPQHDVFTRKQIADFASMASRICEVLGYKPLWHIANSGGITRFPEARFDMVRLGIGLHGVGSSPAETALLMPTVTLRTVIAQVKRVPKGDSIGYGRRFITERDTRIAILPIGYADGLSRRLGNGAGKVWVKGIPAPFVGSICMDMCMVDVTLIETKPGDDVVVFGQGHSLQDYANDLGTIPYEALTSISSRVKRVYTQG